MVCAYENTTGKCAFSGKNAAQKFEAFYEECGLVLVESHLRSDHMDDECYVIDEQKYQIAKLKYGF